MRYFIITNPNLSAGRPGELIPETKLGQPSAEKLEEFLKLGYVREVTMTGERLPQAGDEPVDTPPPPPPPMPGAELLDDDAEPDDDWSDPENYDPAVRTVEQVKTFVFTHPDQHDAVLARELSGRNRSTLVDALRGED